MEMRRQDFSFDLPQELIAQDPLKDRAGSRLLVLDKETGAVSHHVFREIKEYLHPGDCLVLNDTKVHSGPADRIQDRYGCKDRNITVKRKEDNIWETLVKPGKKAKPGARISFGDGLLVGKSWMWWRREPPCTLHL